MNRQRHILCLLAVLLSFAAQLAVGTDVTVALLFSGSILFGLYAVSLGGGVRSPAGLLNAMMIVKFLVIAIVLKVFLLSPVDENLLSPVATASVMALGFLGLLTGTWIQRALPSLRLLLIPAVFDPKMYFALAMVFLVCGYGGYLVAIGPELAGGELQTGGFIGVARAMSSFKSFAIVPALYYAWQLRGRRMMTHPLVLAILIIQITAGAFTTGKLDAMEPLAFYLLVGFLRYGFMDKRLWAAASVGVIYYALIVYPYSQYVRSHGGREGSGQERLEAMTTVLWQIATDPDFRQMVDTKIRPYGHSYLGEEWQPFARFAMVGEADRLISATEEQQSFTGWETIVWGFQLMMPSFLYPEKPIWGTGNYLAHIAGDVNSSDMTTQVAYGVMANLYNAFSYGGVFLGSAIFFSVFYYVLRVFFRDPVWSPSPSGDTIWYFLIVAAFGHSLVEQSLAGLIAAVPMTVAVVVAFCLLARMIASFLPVWSTRA